MLELALHGLCWGAGFWILWRIATLPKASGDASSISVIIPARDEARRLPALLDALNAQTLKPLEILVVDDHSTDGTGDLAKGAGARVIPSAPLPEGWRGKTWACHQGARAAKGRWLLFFDADVRPRPEGLARIAAALQKGGAVSVLPYHTTVRWVEDLSAYFNLVQAAASNAFSWRGRAAGPRRLFGPVLAIAADDFWRVGGYEKVKDRWVENFDLSEHLEALGVPLAAYAGRGAVDFRMYAGGAREIAAGWGKSFALGGKGTPLAVWIGWSLWLTGGIEAARLLAESLATGQGLGLAGLVYAVYGLQAYGWLRRLGSFRLISALAHPVLAAFFVGVFARSLFRLALGRPLVWKGRTNQ